MIQGVGGNPECREITEPDGTHKFEPFYPDPRFTSKTYFLFLGSVLSLSLFSFVCLNKLKIARGERVKLPASTETLPTDMNAPKSYKSDAGWSMSKQTYCYLLGMMSVVCLLGNGILPSIQSYSCLAYSNIAYHLTVNLASMALPLAMCLGFVIKIPKVNVLTILMAIYLIFASLVFYLALSSPTPPFHQSWFGVVLVVLVWVFTSGLNGFIKMCITTMFRPDPGRGLFYIGIATQLGSLIGAIISFMMMVNYSGWFQSYSPCIASEH